MFWTNFHGTLSSGSLRRDIPLMNSKSIAVQISSSKIRYIRSLQMERKESSILFRNAELHCRWSANSCPSLSKNRNQPSHPIQHTRLRPTLLITAYTPALLSVDHVERTILHSALTNAILVVGATFARTALSVPEVTVMINIQFGIHRIIIPRRIL